MGETLQFRDNASEVETDKQKRTIGSLVQPFSGDDSHNSHGEVFEPGSFTRTIQERFVEARDSNPLIKNFWAHMPWMPVGKPRHIEETPEGLRGVAQIAETQLGNDLLELAELGIMNQVSIGFNHRKWERDPAVVIQRGPWRGMGLIRVSDAELFEWSFLPFASDENAVSDTVNRSGALSLNQFRMIRGGMLPAEPSLNDFAGIENGEFVTWTEFGGRLRCGVLDGTRDEGFVPWSGGLEFIATRETPVGIVKVCELQDGKWTPTGEDVGVYLHELRGAGSMTLGALEGETRAVNTFQDLKLTDRDRPWDALAADRRLRRWASADGSGEFDQIDWAKYQRAHLWTDRATKKTLAAHRLRFADVVDGELVASWRGVASAAGALQGGRTPLNIPDEDVERLRKVVGRYYKKARSVFGDESITVPWDSKKATSRDAPGGQASRDPNPTPQTDAGGESSPPVDTQSTANDTLAMEMLHALRSGLTDRKDPQ